MGKTIRAKRKTHDEWFELITECRQSGLTDSQWCQLHDIPVATFRGAVQNLRKANYTVPETMAGKTSVPYELIADIKPEPVKIDLVNDLRGCGCENTIAAQTHTDGVLEICFESATIKVPNGTDPYLLASILSHIGR